MKVFKAVHAIPRPFTDEWFRRSLFEKERPVSYEPGTPALPSYKGSCLYAFRTLWAAQAFVRSCKFHNGTIEIWRCEAEVSRKKPVICQAIHQIEGFWSEGGKSWWGMDAPSGTILCKSITLVEMISTETRRETNE